MESLAMSPTASLMASAGTPPPSPTATSPNPTGQTHLLPLPRGQCGRDAGRPASVHAVLGQCEGLLHAEAGEGRVQVVAVQAHGGGHGPLNGAAAPLPGVFPAVSIGRLVPEKEEPTLRGGSLAPCEWQRATTRCAKHFTGSVSFTAVPCCG